MGLGASAHAALAEDPCHGRDNPLEGGGERLDAHLAAASARLRAIRASFSWPYEAGDDPRGDGVALPLERMAEMLLPGERALEQGWVRRANGEYFVASRALMPGATGAMLQWWFSWCDTGYKYRLWHPEDHVWCTWSARALATAVAERRPGCWIGESHIVVEHMGRAFGGPAEDIRIEFRDPAAYGLTPELLAAARPRVVAVFTARVCAREPGLGDVAAGHFIHVARELPSGGIELRSRFWLGRDVEKLGDALLPPAFLVRFVGQLKVVRCLKIPRSRAMGVMRHAFEEFNTLGAILPQVFEQEASAEWKARSEDELRSRGEAQ